MVVVRVAYFARVRYESNWMNTVTHRVERYQVYGLIQPGLFLSLLLSMILEWNMLEKKMQCIWLAFSSNIMRFPNIGQAANTSEWPLIGTTITSKSIYPWSMPGYIEKALQRFEIWTWASTTVTKLAASTHNTNIWSKDAICGARYSKYSFKQGGTTIHPSRYRNIVVL